METKQPPDKVWTYDDLPNEYEGRKYEIFDGELVVSPSPRVGHQLIAKRLYTLLYEGLEVPRIARVYFAPLDVVLSPRKVFQPDLLAIRWDRRLEAIGDRNITAPPDLAIEILSPSNTAHDRVKKRRFYARNGIREYWIVDPEDKTIEVLQLVDGGLSYREHGWYGPGDRVRGATFELAFDLDPVFAADED